jgi:hypothetical protein
MMDLLYIIGLFVIILALAYVSYRNFVSLDERLRKIESILQGAQVVVRPSSSTEMERNQQTEEESVVSGWGGQESKSIKLESSNQEDVLDIEEDEQEMNLHIQPNQEDSKELNPDEIENVIDESLPTPVTSSAPVLVPASSSNIVMPTQDELAQLEKEFNVSSSHTETEVVSSASQHKPGTKYIGITAVKTALQNAGISFQKNAKKEDLMKLAEENGIHF